MWRFSGVVPEEPLGVLMQRIEAEKHVPVHQQNLSKDPKGEGSLDPSLPLAACGIARNGDVLHLRIDPEAEALSAGGAQKLTGRKIGPDGSIITVSYEEHNESAGFRPGMPKLRDIKGAWTLTDFLLMDEQFVYRIKKEKGNNVSDMCTHVTLDGDSLNAFVTYLQQLGWAQSRVGYLYGNFEEDGSVKVQSIYEPPQECSAEGFEMLEDPREEQVARLAEMLGMRRVGWIFAHPPREDGFMFSGQEVIFAAMQQLEAADGVEKTPFVTVRCHMNEEGHGEFDAYQVTMQGMEMVAEGALETDEADRSACAVTSTYTAILEGKEAKKVPTEMFLLNVPVKHSTDPLFAKRFPDANRLGAHQSPEALKDSLSHAPALIDGLRDFNLLLFLMDFPDMFGWDSDMPRIVQSVVDSQVPLEEGHSLMIKSFAGMELD